MFRHGGPRTRRLSAYLARRARTPRPQRAALDQETSPSLVRRHAVVFTDTADFTRRTARHGILHFLMVFDRVIAAAEPVLRRAGGEIVKVEGDSLLLRFHDVASACRGVDALEALLRSWNRGHPADEHMRFSYGIGGDVLEPRRTCSASRSTWPPRSAKTWRGWGKCC
jgi:class 3 adenylate cyclase